jgi:5-hydroxyisourate hydrolase-like protein (transthyretin family)
MQRFILLILMIVLLSFVSCNWITDITSRPTTPPTQIHGIVREQSSALPIEGVHVQLWRYPTLDQRPEQGVSTDANGRFEFDPLPISETDTLILTVQGIPHWLPDQRQRTGAEVWLNSEFLFDLSRLMWAGDLGWVALAGQVLDAQTGLPVPEAEVHFSGHSYMRTIPEQTVVADLEGRFVLHPVFLHDTDGIRVTAEKAGYIPGEIRRSGLETYYDKTFMIELQVEDDDSAP